MVTYAHNQSQKPQILGLTAPFEARRDASGLYGTFRINVDSLTASARHQVTPSLTADVTATGGDSVARRLAAAGFGQALNEGRDWSAEGVLNWSPDGPLRAVGGASRTPCAAEAVHQPVAARWLARAVPRRAGFGWPVRRGEHRRDAAHDADGGAALPAGPAEARRGAVDQLRGDPADVDRTFHAWLPKLSVAHDFSSGVRAGLLVQRAYNPGGTTLRFDIARPDNFEAERLWDYELFIRARLGDGLNATANVFYYDMRDAQRLKAISIFTPLGRRVGFADLFNAPKARSYGAEAELSWRVHPRLSARLSAGLLRTKLIDAGPDYPEFTGNDFARSPAFSAAAAIDWTVVDRLRVVGQARYRSAFFADAGQFGPGARARRGDRRLCERNMASAA